MMRPTAKRTKIWAIHMPNMAEKAKQEVGCAKQELRSYLGNRVYIYSIICQIRPKKLNRKLVPPNRKKQEV